MKYAPVQNPDSHIEVVVETPLHAPDLQHLKTENEIQAQLHTINQAINCAEGIIHYNASTRKEALFAGVIDRRMPTDTQNQQVRSTAETMTRHPDPRFIEDTVRRDIVTDQLSRLLPAPADVGEPVEHYVYGMFGKPVTLITDVVDDQIEETFYADIVVANVRLRDRIPNGSHKIHHYGSYGLGVTLREGGPTGAPIFDMRCASLDPILYARSDSDAEKAQTLGATEDGSVEATLETIQEVLASLNPRLPDPYEVDNHENGQLGRVLRGLHYTNWLKSHVTV